MNEPTSKTMTITATLSKGGKKNLVIPKDLNLDIMAYAADGVMGGDDIKDGRAAQSVLIGMSDPKDIAVKTLVTAMVGAQNRSNILYSKGTGAVSNELKEIYFKYADKYANKVIQAAAILQKFIGENNQKIVVERVNVEAGAQAIVGNVKHV